MTLGLFPAGAVNQNVPHRLGGGGKKMSLILEG